MGSFPAAPVVVVVVVSVAAEDNYSAAAAVAVDTVVASEANSLSQRSSFQQEADGFQKVFPARAGSLGRSWTLPSKNRSLETPQSLGKETPLT